MPAGRKLGKRAFRPAGIDVERIWQIVGGRARVLPSKWSRNGKIPPEAGLRQRREQRLRLGDHRHLRRRRKACERGREDSVGFDETAGRLVELGER
jgi:hypothetical protein